MAILRAKQCKANSRSYNNTVFIIDIMRSKNNKPKIILKCFIMYVIWKKNIYDLHSLQQMAKHTFVFNHLKNKIKIIFSKHDNFMYFTRKSVKGIHLICFKLKFSIFEKQFKNINVQLTIFRYIRKES